MQGRMVTNLLTIKEIQKIGTEIMWGSHVYLYCLMNSISDRNQQIFAIFIFLSQKCIDVSELCE
jgi:hypothetical protein